MKMDKEKFKRLPVIKQMYQLAALGYGRCNCCGMPWKYCVGHDIMVTKYDGYHAVCEYCWNTGPYTKVKDGVNKWINQVTPEYPHTRGEYRIAFIDEWFKPVNDVEDE